MKPCSNYVTEKFKLQEYEGKIQDMFLGDMKQLDKIALLVCLSLYKYDAFCIRRMIKIYDRRIFLTYVLYSNKSDEENIKSSVKKISGMRLSIGPSDAIGYAKENKIVVFINVDTHKAPFLSSKYNSDEYEYIYKNIADSMTLNDAMISEADFGALNITSYKKRLKNIEELFFKTFEEEYGEDVSKAKQRLITFSARKLSDCIDTVRHELTHIMDTGGAREANHFSQFTPSDIKDISDLDSSDQDDLEIAQDILYRLWSRTEFNAYSQGYGRNTNISNKPLQRSLKRMAPNRVNPSEMGSSYKAISKFTNSIKEDCDKLSYNNNKSFWKAIKIVVIRGLNNPTEKIKIDKMSIDQFKKYFVNTTYRLIDKFNKKTLKNANMQVVHDSDITRLASIIKLSCDKYLEERHKKTEKFYMPIRFDYFTNNQSYHVIIAFNVPEISTEERLLPKILCNISQVNIIIRQLKINSTQSVTQFFDSYRNSFYNLYLELTRQGGPRKTLADKLCFSLADDIYISLNKKL